MSQHAAVTRLLTIVAAALFPVALPAASQSLPSSDAAVAAVNGDLSIGYLYNSIGDASSATLQSYGATATINLPIWKFIGASASLYASRSRFKAEFAKLGLGEDIKASANEWGADGSIFVRDPTIGRIRATYANALSYRGDPFPSYQYGIDGEYYLAQWTVAAGLTRRPTDIWFADGPFDPVQQKRINLTNYLVSAAAYPVDEVRIDVGYERVDVPVVDGINAYRVGVEYQPAFLGNRFSGGLTLRRLDAPSNTNVYGVSLTWFFGAQPDLKTRDRYYR